MSIHYQITPIDPHAHLFEVQLSFATPQREQVFSLPNWIPGSYMIRDFSRHIVQISAWSGSNELPLRKLDKSHWLVSDIHDELQLIYQVYAWDLSVRAAHLDASHGFFNGTSVFLTVDGQEEAAVTVDILPPEGDDYAAWQVATSLPQSDVDARGYGRYTAADYDELIDHPVEMGDFTRVTFDACGVPHEVVLTGRFDADLERVCADLKTICEYQINFFGQPAPMDRYVFLIMVVGDGYGGLEHRASTSLLVSRRHLPAVGEDAITDDYLEFLGLCSHEYFHTWNVKRIKPAAFTPYQLQQESHTTQLWAFEGITSYYDDLVLVRCGLIDAARYLKVLSKTLTRVYRGAGRRKQSVSDSSFDAWNKFYKQDENAPNAIVSYYAKGALVALSLDVELRKRSDGQVSMDQLMHRLWQDWRETGNGLAEDAIERLAAELVGEDMSGFFDHAVRGTEDLPLEASFATLGVDCRWRAAASLTDMGGEAKTFDRPPLSLGMRYKAHDQGVQLVQVFEGGAAMLAGLSAGDVIVAVERYAMSVKQLERLQQRKRAGDALAVHFFRHGELREATLVLQAAEEDTCYLVARDDASDAMAAWLGSRQPEA
ncbi:MAG TPA: peptidase M61 [Gammaproteobacteria bacterium]|nr:peptidase M61 [Gammaproteobacteria bacterium]